MSLSYYTSLSGMMAASYGLQNSSNNLANMQSPGFKRKDVFYSSLGTGVSIHNQVCNFSQGHYLETGNPSDLAIVGHGFFIVKLNNGELIYTRDGEFEFNKAGLLIDKQSQGLVQGYNSKGELVSLHQFGSKTSPGKATQSIDLKGELIIIPLEKGPEPLPESKYERISFTVSVFDAKGKSHQIHLSLQSPHSPADFNEQLHWVLVDASCADAELHYAPGQAIEFENDNSFDGGSAKKDSNSLTFKLFDSQIVTLNFGDFTKDRESAVRLFNKDQSTHTTTNLDILNQNGFGFGQPIGCSFDDNGQLSYQYDNGQTEQGLHLALASFDDPSAALTPTDGNAFRVNAKTKTTIGRANQRNFGAIQAKKLESSNVDSTNEFASLVVLQRMFQACSQLMDIEKQLLQELYKK